MTTYWEEAEELVDEVRPQVIKGLEEIRKIDFQVEKKGKKNEKKMETLFASIRSMTDENRKKQYHEIKAGFQDMLEQTDKKVRLATLTENLVKRLIGRLDNMIEDYKEQQELEKSMKLPTRKTTAEQVVNGRETDLKYQKRKTQSKNRKQKSKETQHKRAEKVKQGEENSSESDDDDPEVIEDVDDTRPGPSRRR